MTFRCQPGGTGLMALGILSYYELMQGEGVTNCVLSPKYLLTIEFVREARAIWQGHALHTLARQNEMQQCQASEPGSEHQHGLCSEEERNKC